MLAAFKQLLFGCFERISTCLCCMPDIECEMTKFFACLQVPGLGDWVTQLYDAQKDVTMFTIII